MNNLFTEIKFIVLNFFLKISENSLQPNLDFETITNYEEFNDMILKFERLLGIVLKN